MYHTIIIVGNLGREPDSRYSPSGQPVTSFSVATNRNYKNQNGEDIKETIWFRVTAWGKLADNCQKYLHKGSKVLIEGRLTPDLATGGPRISNYNGKTYASYEIVANTVRFLSSQPGSEMSGPSTSSSLEDDDYALHDAGVDPEY